jgi:hypothetical protein
VTRAVVPVHYYQSYESGEARNKEMGKKRERNQRQSFGTKFQRAAARQCFGCAVFLQLAVKRPPHIGRKGPSSACSMRL